MKQYSNEEIVSARERMQRKFQEETAEIGESKFTYFIMPQELNPNLVHFVWQCSNAQTGVFGISDSVPQLYRPFAVYHEILESKMSGEDKCRRALEMELKLVPQEIKRDYALMRSNFFKQLTEYARVNNYGEERVKAFEDNASKLEQIAGGQSD